jgi:outer membrane protein assembly factor BamB
VAVGAALACLVLLVPASAGAGSSPRAAPKVDWRTYGFNAKRSGFNPNETVLTPATVGGLHVKWQRQFDGVSITSPIVATGVAVGTGFADLVFVGTEHGELSARRASNGHLVWQRELGSVQTACRDMPDQRFGISGTPLYVRADNTLYVASADGVAGQLLLYALDASTGATRTGWPVALSDDPVHTHVWSAINADGTDLYVTTAGICDIPPYFGRVFAINRTSGAIDGRWTVVHAGDEVHQGGGIWSYGGAAVTRADRSVFVATGNALPPDPESQPYADSVVRLKSGALGLRVSAASTPGLFGGDVDFGSTPILYQTPGCEAHLVALNKTGALFLYRADSVETGPIQRLRITLNREGRGKLIGSPAFDKETGMLYVSDPGPDRDPFVHGMLALREDASCRLTEAWNQEAGPDGTTTLSTPTVAGGVVYYGDGRGETVRAFDAVTGGPLWDSGTTFTGPVFAAPVVVNGRLYVVSWNDTGGSTLTMFGL